MRPIRIGTAGTRSLSRWPTSLVAGALTKLGTAAIGVPLAFCLARVSLPGKGALLTLSALPLLLPSFVSAYALTLLFGHAGVIVVALRQIGLPIGSIYGMRGVVIVFVLTLYPYVLMPTLTGFRARGAVLLSLFPFGAVLVISFLQFHGPVLSWELGFGNYAALLGGSYQPLYNTGILATIAAIVTTILGAPIGYVLVRHRNRLATLLDMVSVVPFAVTGTVLGIGLITAFNIGCSADRTTQCYEGRHESDQFPQ